MKSIAILALLVLSIAGCAPRPILADSSGKAAPPPIPASPDGLAKAHLHVYLGRTHGQLFSYPNWRDSDFYINEIDVGTVTTADYLDIDLDPGVYAFSWCRTHDFLGKIESTRDYDMLQPGQDVFLALDVDQNAGSWLPPLGWWIDPDTGRIADTARLGRSALADRRPVRPDYTILARLRPIAGPATYLPSSW